MVSQKVTIKNPTGLHLRPAGILCKVLGACIKSGDEIELVCEGEDEKEALTSIVTAIENGLGE